ncbi:MAG: hypothetical protein U0840_00745 [Gemmataceae bacterium]
MRSTESVTVRYSPPAPANKGREVECVPADLHALDDFLGWRRWLPGRLLSQVIPGRHGLHLREPYMQTLTAKLRITLVRACALAP